MTDLLTSSTAREAPARGARRSLGISSALAGAGAAGITLSLCLAFGLVGWFASAAGAYGDTRDALRVGADAWLLAHGSELALSGATVSIIPLGLTLLCAYVAFRTGRWAGAGATVDDDGSAVLGATVLAGVYGVVATVAAVLASLEQARTSPGAAFVGAFTISFVAGGAGLLSGSGRGRSVRGRLPTRLLAVCSGVASGVLLMFTAGSVLLLAGLLADFGSAANVLARLHTDAAGGLLYTLVVAAVTPNAALLGSSYLVGPGFAVGAGTVVSPSAVVLGPVPAFPLLAALPAGGATPSWAVALVGVPVLVGALAAGLSLRRSPLLRYELGTLHGLVVGGLSGLVLGAATALAGGAVGPGRMREVGPPVVETMLSAAVAMGIGGLVAGLVTTWWLRRGAGR